MRSAGQSIAAAMMLAACGDAAGSKQAPAAIDSAAIDLSAAVPADAGDTLLVSETAQDKAAMLGNTADIAYECENGSKAYVLLFGAEEVASVLIPGWVETPAYYECSPTRVGPECTDGEFRMLINTVEDKARFSDAAMEQPVSCTVMQPQ